MTVASVFSFELFCSFSKVYFGGGGALGGPLDHYCGRHYLERVDRSRCVRVAAVRQYTMISC